MHSKIRRYLGALDTVYHDLAGGKRGGILLFVACGWLVIYGTRFIFPALAPELLEVFEITNTTIGLTITAIWVAYASVQFPSGHVSDRIGERFVLVSSSVLTVCSILIIVYSPVFAVFFLGSVLFGLGTGLYGPPRMLVLSNTFRNRDNTAIGLTFAAGSIGSAALPFLAGVLAVRFGWKVGFTFVIPLVVLIGIGLWWVLPRSTRNGSGTAEPVGFEMIRRLKNGVVRAPVLLAWTGITLSIFVFQGLTAFLPTYLVVTKGMTAGTAAAIFGLFFVCNSVFQPFGGGLADRYGRGRVLAATATIAAVSMIVLPFLDTTFGLVSIVILLGVRGIIGPVNNAYLVAALPDDVRGSGYGLLRMIYMGLGATGAVFVGTLADADLFDEAFVLLGVISVLSVFFYAKLPRLP